MDLLIFGRPQHIFAEFQQSWILTLDGFIQYLTEIFNTEMLYIPLIGCQVDRQGQQLNRTDIGMREEYQLHHVIHTVSIGQSVPNTSFSRQQIQNIQRSHPIGGILRQ